MTSLHQVLGTIAGIEDVLFVTKSGGATAEIRSSTLSAGGGPRQSGRWVTIGSNDGPAHMHVDSEAVSRAEFIRESRTAQRDSFSVRFFDGRGNRVLAAFFTKMYDESGRMITGRLEEYERARANLGNVIKFGKNNAPA